LNRDHGFNLKVDGDFGPETFWDNGKTTNAILTVLEKVGGKLAKEPDAHPVNNGKGGRTVFLEIGHGPQPGGAFDPGAVRLDPAGNKTEHELNIVVANAIKARLGQLGVTCVIGDIRAQNFASGQQAKGHDLAISIHHNSHVDGSKAQGAEFIRDPRSKNPKSNARLGAVISAAIAKELGIADRGVKDMRLAVTSGFRSVGVPYYGLLETYFVQRRPDANPATADMEEWSRRGGVAAANAIAAFLGTV
jgi:N-acetylmuramoyl-L-alanine amidase